MTGEAGFVGSRRISGTAIDKVLSHADCQSAIQPIGNRRYSVAQTGSLLYRRLLTGYGLRHHLRGLCRWSCSFREHSCQLE